jgi:hypothetical protein
MIALLPNPIADIGILMFLVVVCVAAILVSVLLKQGL